MGREIVAMILAGGRGTRLEALTAKVAKPAVHFGGKYRIIDFPLSNCANSGIDIVGVLTQYESVLLGTYVGAGTKWGLDGKQSLAAILPARERGKVGATWYAGTADAIYQNISFLDQYDPEYVVTFKTDRMTVESEQDVKWTLDGEDGGILKSVNIRSLQRRVQILSLKM